MAAALYALICLIWGSTWLAIKVGLVGVPPFLGAGLRFLLSTLLVGLVLAARRTRVQLTRDDRTCVLSLGLLVFWLDYAAVYWAETRISSGLTAILFSTMPLTTSLLSAYWTRSETLSVRKVIGILVGVLGTALLFWPHERLGLQQALGMLASLAGSLCAAINLVMMKKHNLKLPRFGGQVDCAAIVRRGVKERDRAWHSRRSAAGLLTLWETGIRSPVFQARWKSCGRVRSCWTSRPSTAFPRSVSVNRPRTPKEEGGAGGGGILGSAALRRHTTMPQDQRSGPRTTQGSTRFRGHAASPGRDTPPSRSTGAT